MPNNATQKHDRLRGVQHPPEADIQNIRDLLRGYGTEGSLIKELIQNAEDAGAHHLDLILTPGDPKASHPLLRGPGLCAVNDGNFEPKHRDAIFRLGLGTKGADPRAIGRFGKGLKSVFALCEAFFVVANANQEHGWDHEEICEFFNPWNGWRHADWDEAFDNAGADLVFSHIALGVKEFREGCRHWLAFWLPLRHSDHRNDAKGSVAWIHESSGDLLPGKDGRMGITLDEELRKLAPSLVTLRNLHRIRLIDMSGSTRKSTKWSLGEGSNRISEPGSIREPERLIGSMILEDSAGLLVEIKYAGYAGTLPESRVAEAKAHDKWPKIVDMSETGSSADQNDKGEPHYATVLTTSPSSVGKLEVRWSVFFPVGEQPDGVQTVALPCQKQVITLNLHGFFFLDTERRRVDGLQQDFKTNSNPACLGWNQIIAKEGTLAHIPKTLATFTTQQTQNSEQCAELSNAIKQTWVWSKFSAAICRNNAWRPRWRTGVEVWECAPSETPVLAIPTVHNSREIVTNIPGLAAISETRTLVARGADGSLLGLFNGKCSNWPEELVLLLFKKLQLNAAGNEKTATWINQFLEDLYENKAITPLILEQASALPLLPATDLRTKSVSRISVTEWISLTDSKRLFTRTNDGENWFNLLSATLPNWSCLVSPSWGIPRWLTNIPSAVCNGAVAAEIVLTQTILGGFSERLTLVNAFAALTHRETVMHTAIRFLMHANVSRAKDVENLLFMPSVQPGQQIWSRLIEELLKEDGGAHSWRFLHDQWSSVLSAQIQRELGVSTVNAEGAWATLTKDRAVASAIEFPSEQWSCADISSLLKGLFEAGRATPQATLEVLRQLRLHTLRGHPESRVPISDEKGELGEFFVLDKPGFDAGIPSDLQPLWQVFLTETKVIERLPANDLSSGVQNQLFQNNGDDQATYVAELDWNYVVRHCLGVADPSNQCPLILEALKHGDQAVRGIGQKLKKVTWIPLALTGSIAPDSVLIIEGLDSDLERLLDPAKDGLAGVLSLPEAIREHDGFKTLRNYLPRVDQALKLLSLWMEEKPNWHLGLTDAALPKDIDDFLRPLETLDELPGASFLAKLRRLESRREDERWGPLLKETIWTSLLRRFPYDQGGVVRLESVLSRLAGSQSRTAFDAYLRQACDDGIIEPLLQNLLLVNKRGRWVPATKLIWPSENIDPGVQLCVEQAAILSALQVMPPNQAAQENEKTPRGMFGNQLTELPDFEVEVKKLEDFLRPFRNGNVGDNLPAALVAVLGRHPSMVILLQSLLQGGLHQDPKDFCAWLLDERTQELLPLMGPARFLVEIVRGAKTWAHTITCETIQVDLASDVTTLLVGDPSELWRRRWFQNRLDTECHLLRLRWIERPDELTDGSVTAFASTIEAIILKVYCNGVASLCPSNIKGVLDKIADTGQADLRRSQSFLIDMAEARLKELGVRESPQLAQIMREFGDARQARVDADLFQDRNPSLAHRRGDDASRLERNAKSKLRDLLVAPEDVIVRQTLVSAIRCKMSDYDYHMGSVALEIFQNADDAVAELEEMRGGLLAGEDKFVLRFNSDNCTLEFFHWGRPINQHSCPGFTGGERRGFDQDLQKMLTLNFSDKGVGSTNLPLVVTGRFGLGFKSVFFVAEQPEVISGRLAFEIRGGFFPVPLKPLVAEEMRHNAMVVSGGHTATTTAIRLNWAGEEVTDLLKAMDRFECIAPLLTVFSRNIRTVVFEREGSLTFTNIETPLTETGRINRIQVGTLDCLAFRCPIPMDKRPATVLLRLEGNGISSLPPEFPQLWITAPTSEHSELRWALNAPFKPDAGRQRLALNTENRDIATESAVAWGHALVELFDKTDTDWDRLAEQLGLHTGANAVTWWHQFWIEMTRSSPVLKWEDLRDGGQVLGWLAWGTVAGAVRRLIQQRAAMPNALPGPYLRLVKCGEVKFCISGLLAEKANGCFDQIANWASVQNAFPANQTVHADIDRFLQLTKCVQPLRNITLQSVLAVEIGSKFEVDQHIGDRIGALFLECKAVLGANTPYTLEVESLNKWLEQIKLLAKNSAYYSVTNLVCNRPLVDLIEKDEPLRAAFAPDSAVLSPGYSDIALRFFVKARGQLTANAVMLADWARASSPSQLAAVFQYLIHGELGQQLADQLQKAWLDTKRSTATFCNLPVGDQSELERKFFKGEVWTQPLFPLPPILVEIPATQVMPAKVAFRLISEWWRREQKSWEARYEEKTYPSGFPGKLPWAGDDDWNEVLQPSAESRWLILFIQAALLPLGFNRIGRDQSFSRFLVADNWLDVFASVSTEPDKLLVALDYYLNSFIQNTQYHFQMRQFVAFYAVARNLESFLYSLRSAEISTQPESFNMVFSPKANPSLRGTGIDAPPLGGMLGMGTCQLLRELYRLGRLTNPNGYRFAFTPIRKVRRLCTQLFGLPEGLPGAAASEVIFSGLKSLAKDLGLDPTFNHCFDLPLQFLAEDSQLRARVLDVVFETVSSDDEKLDSAPQNYTP